MYREYRKNSHGTKKTKARPDYTSKTSKNKNEMGFSFLSDMMDSFEDTLNDIFTYGKEKKRKTACQRDEELRKKGQKKDDKHQENEKEKPPKPKPEPPKRKPNVIPEEELVKKLRVEKVDFCIERNTELHHTDSYECCQQRKDDNEQDCEAELVIRRGAPFRIVITFDRPYEIKANNLILIFQTGNNPKPNRGTEAFVRLDEEGEELFDPYGWGATLVDPKGEKDLKLSECQIAVDAYAAADCPIGEWELKIRTFDKGKTKDGQSKILICDYDHDENLTILFNPWCEHDSVYFKDTTQLEEYILNQTGAIYSGNQWSQGGKPWNFGQFEAGMIDAALYLVRKGLNFNVESMADPLKVCRIVSQMVNNFDDDGALAGNWSGNYEGGTKPTQWLGSVKIFKEFMETGQPVRFGQCWVFSGLVTTVCRALGIPARSITNFASAHDTDGSCTIDTVQDADGNQIPDKCDSVWNFHVWNEVWMERPDLSPDYDGWQVIDATPQEASGGVYCCGPASLVAIKRGECDKPYDTGFVFAEVNGDRVTWMPNEQGKLVPTEIKTDSVGKCISTKKATGKPWEPPGPFSWGGDKDQEDVTNQYKFPEGSAEERAAALRANQTATKKKDVYNIKTEQQDVRCRLLHKNEVQLGQPLEIKFSAKNEGKLSRKLKEAKIKVFICDYTGNRVDPKHPIKEQIFTEKNLDTQEECEFKITLQPEEYEKHLIEQANIQIESLSTVEKRGFKPAEIKLKNHDLRFRRPDLECKLKQTEAKIDDLVEVEVVFKNPLHIPLTDVVLSCESGGCRRVEDKRESDIPAQGQFKDVIRVRPKLKGAQSINISLESKQLQDISGSAILNVKKK